MTTIENNPSQLTDREKALLSTAESFEYLYGVGMIFISQPMIVWDCSNSAGALEYLKSRNVPQTNLRTSHDKTGN